MADLIRVGAFSYNLVIGDKVLEVNRFLGMESMMLHIMVNKTEPGEPVQPYLGLPLPPV